MSLFAKLFANIKLSKEDKGKEELNNNDDNKDQNNPPQDEKKLFIQSDEQLGLDKVFDPEEIDALSCQVCYSRYGEGRRPVTLRCGHTLCQTCLGSLRHKVCHVCRGDILVEPAPNILMLELLEVAYAFGDKSNNLIRFVRNPNIAEEIRQELTTEFEKQYIKKVEEVEEVEKKIVDEFQQQEDLLTAKYQKALDETYAQAVEESLRIREDVEAEFSVKLKESEKKRSELFEKAKVLDAERIKSLEREVRILEEDLRRKDRVIENIDKHNRYLFEKNLELQFRPVDYEYCKPAIPQTDINGNRCWICPLCKTKNPWNQSNCMKWDFDKYRGAMINGCIIDPDFPHRNRICEGLLCYRCTDRPLYKEEIAEWHKNKRCQKHHEYKGTQCRYCELETEKEIEIEKGNIGAKVYPGCAEMRAGLLKSLAAVDSQIISVKEVKKVDEGNNNNVMQFEVESIVL